MPTEECLQARCVVPISQCLEIIWVFRDQTGSDSVRLCVHSLVSNLGIEVDIEVEGESYVGRVRKG
jgi:hypothetical protein